MLSSEAMISKLEGTGDYKVLRRLLVHDHYDHRLPDDEIRNGIVLDVETTGLDTNHDAIIEIALVPFTFSSDGRLFDVGAAYHGFQEPPEPLSEEIVALTGLTDEVLKGQSINLPDLEQAVESAHLIVAHNAGFDRLFSERLSPCFMRKAWACSLKEVPWKAEGFRHASLEYIAYGMGFFFDGHRAENDCRTALELLSKPLPVSGKTGFDMLLDSARKPTIRVWAEGSPFDTKDQLKRRGYRWSNGDDGRLKSWYKDVHEEEAEAEKSWLEEEIYGRSTSIFTTRITAFDRYSGREG